MKIGPLRSSGGTSQVQSGGYRTSPVVVHRLLMEDGANW